ncbi:hypothetical protein GIB67_026926 [Kingdonia uniflora]|uniref:Uncharacterized protein n=1 Tax=Kingdonia uniflora TaxID=39325 RepID=A0A7J7P1D0_9MAGN|nr:hypothetical protein GIB67_026926 [Kingdonia uniflora]
MQRLQRLRTTGKTLAGSFSVPRLRRKALNSWSACQDTYFSTKDIFERHKVVFTVSTSIASVGTAWAGYSIRQMHQAKVEKKLETIEDAVSIHCIHIFTLLVLSGQEFGVAFIIVDPLRIIARDFTIDSNRHKMKHNRHMEHADLKRIIDIGNVSTAACIATAGTSLVVGYFFGWRGGRWYANRKHKKEQLKLLEQLKPRRWQFQFPRRFQFLRRPFSKSSKPLDSSVAAKLQKNLNTAVPCNCKPPDLIKS